MQNNLVLLHISLIEGAGPVAAQKILAAISNLTDIYQMTAEDIGRQADISLSLSQEIWQALQDKRTLEKELALIDKHEVQWISLACPEYPEILKTIHMPPPIIYVQGSALRETQKRIAIVGSRDANDYGKSVINSLVPTLVERGWVIVSGGALGADAFAHQATLDANGNTVVVLGAGLLNAGPPSNKYLFDAVVGQGGTLLSIFPMEMEGYKGNFPARNRVISGLSKGTVVIQAAKKSGALITAQFALDDAREVFAVPGPINDPLSAGCHAIIKQGAQLVHNVGDILQVFGEPWVDKEAQDEQATPKAVRVRPATKPVPRAEVQEELFTYPTPMEELIARACVRPCSIDELLAITSLTLPELQDKLFTMQLEGKLLQNVMGMWEKR